MSKNKYFGSTLGLSILKDNPAEPTKGMVAKVSNTIPAHWQNGDIRLATLADTVAETIVGSGELVTNGTFATNTAGWTVGNGATLSIDTARLKVLNGTGGLKGYAYQTIATVVGKAYLISAAFDLGGSSTMVDVRVGSSAFNASLANPTSTSSTGQLLATFVAAETTTTITLANGIATNGTFIYFDNISVKLAEPDRSVKAQGMTVVGSLTKTPVASGANLVSYSGFSASNYLEQPYNSALDFGTGDFCVMGWVNLTSTGTGVLMYRGTAGAGSIGIFTNAGILAIVCSATGGNTVTSVAATTGIHFHALYRVAGVLYYYVDGVLVYSAANTANVTNAAAKLIVGNDYVFSAACLGSLALWRISATAPSADQIAHIYRTELPLFQPNAQCTIDGTSTAVTALAHDDSTEMLQVGTSWGRSSFRDLLRVDSEVSTVGAITSISANGGAISTGGATSAYFYQPALLLRDELKRKDEARKALGKTPVFFEFDAIAAQTAFLVPKGFTAKALYSAGTLKRMGATKDYLVSYDGFAETINFAVAPGASVWVSLMCVRSN